MYVICISLTDLRFYFKENYSNFHSNIKWLHLLQVQTDRVKMYWNVLNW